MWSVYLKNTFFHNNCSIVGWSPDFKIILCACNIKLKRLDKTIDLVWIKFSLDPGLSLLIWWWMEERRGCIWFQEEGPGSRLDSNSMHIQLQKKLNVTVQTNYYPSSMKCFLYDDVSILIKSNNTHSQSNYYETIPTCLMIISCINYILSAVLLFKGSSVHL